MKPNTQREKAAELVTKVCGSMGPAGYVDSVDTFALTAAITEALAAERKSALEGVMGSSVGTITSGFYGPGEFLVVPISAVVLK